MSCNNCALLRLHRDPSAEKLEDLKNYIELYGLGEIDISNRQSLSDSISRIIRDIKNQMQNKELLQHELSPMMIVLELLILRTFSGAEQFLTSTLPFMKDWHHFALNMRQYTHYTSPIRRQPDLIVHRMIERTLKYGLNAGTRFLDDCMITLGEFEDLVFNCNE